MLYFYIFALVSTVFIEGTSGLYFIRNTSNKSDFFSLFSVDVLGKSHPVCLKVFLVQDECWIQMNKWMSQMSNHWLKKNWIEFPEVNQLKLIPKLKDWFVKQWKIFRKKSSKNLNHCLFIESKDLDQFLNEDFLGKFNKTLASIKLKLIYEIITYKYKFIR